MGYHIYYGGGPRDLHYRDDEMKAWALAWEMAEEMAMNTGINPDILGEYRQEDRMGICPEGSDGAYWPIVEG